MLLLDFFKTVKEKSSNASISSMHFSDYKQASNTLRFFDDGKQLFNFIFS